MAGGSGSKSKVREWMRRRMAPRRKAAVTAGSGDNIINDDDDSNTTTTTSSRRSGSDSTSSPRRKLLPSALRWRKPRGNVLAALFHRALYHLLWLVESVVVVAQLCFFYVRFGFRL